MATVLRGRLIALIEPLLKGLGYELVELEFVPGRSSGLLRVYIDHLQGDRPASPGELAAEKNVTVALDSEGRIAEGDETGLTEGGIGIDDCERVSRAVSALLDVEDPIATAYTLEVSSPGSDRVLRLKPHFERFAGSRVHVELKVPRDGRKRYTGMLKSVSDTDIELEVDRQAVRVPFDEIEKARLAPEYASPMRR
jgi:ribosome maturation factor RimP